MSRQQRSPWSVFRLQGFRARLVGVIVVAGFFCIFLNAGLFYAYVLDNYHIILKSTAMPPEDIADRFGDLRNFALVLTALSFTVLVLVVLWMIYVTHRVSGPIYHLHKVIRAIHDGKIDERVYLRRKDEFHELARSFNALMDKFAKSEPDGKQTPGS